MAITLRPVQFISKITSGKTVSVVGFLWGLIEGLFFFIVPDVYILFVALFSAKNGLRAWMYSILGSIVSVLIFAVLITAYSPTYLLNILTEIPGVSQELNNQVLMEVGDTGMPHTPLLVLGGIPLKTYTLVFFEAGFSLFAILLWTVFARVVRIAPGFILASIVGRVSKKSISKNLAVWVIAYLILWLVFYIFYFNKFGF